MLPMEGAASISQVYINNWNGKRPWWRCLHNEYQGINWVACSTWKGATAPRYNDLGFWRSKYSPRLNIDLSPQPLPKVLWKKSSSEIWNYEKKIYLCTYQRYCDKHSPGYKTVSMSKHRFGASSKRVRMPDGSNYAHSNAYSL